jgi:hypothetical protein
MNQPKDTRRLAIIQVDTDGLWVIFQHFGYCYEEARDIMYESSIPRFLELFDTYGIKATFFVVGRDLLYPSRLSLLKTIVKKGHEVANHTMNHAEGFSFLPLKKKKQEIEEAEQIIEGKLGVKIKGFRTPSNDVDAETLKILEEKSYLYDSSILPTYYGPLLKLLKFASLKISYKNHYLGRPQYGLSPLCPYYPSAKNIWQKGSMKIIEVPITTMPGLRLPFHTSFTFATYHLGLGCSLFNLGHSLLKMTSLPLNLVFHTNELSEPIREKITRRQFGLGLALKNKQKICHYILQAIQQDFKVVSTAEYIAACGLKQ